MAENSHSIQITIDSTQAQAGLKALSATARATASDLRSLGSTPNAFAGLSNQLNAASGAFQTLSKSIAALSTASRSLGSLAAPAAGFTGLARGAQTANNALSTLTNTFSLSRQAAEVLGATVGAISLASLAKSAQDAGNSLLSFRIAIDAVAASSKESENALKFIRDTSARIGAPLDAATDSFRNLYTSMRALGRPVPEIQTVFRGFSTAMTAMHVSAADARIAMREIAEAFAQGAVHSRIALLALGSHIPGIAAVWQQALGVNGEKLHEMFRQGGLPLDSIAKAAEILEQRFSTQLPEAFKHSTVNIIALQNAFTRLQQSIYENGFDSGLTTLLKSLQEGFNTLGVDNLGKSIGEAFRGAFVTLSLLTNKVVEAREPILAVGHALATYALASTGIRIIAGAFALLLSPLGALAALTALTSSEWLNLSGVFSGSDAAFNSGAEKIRRLTNGFLDLHKAMKGAIELWELAKGLFDGKSFSESKALAARAGAEFDAGKYGAQKGKEFGQSFVDRASALFGKLGEALQLKLPSFDLKSFNAEWNRLYQESAPHPFVGGGDYASNAQRYGRVDNSLSEELKKVWERISPVNKALVVYKETLAEIAKMKGRIDPLGHVIGDSEITKLKEAAREKAIAEGFPAAAKISELMDRVKLERDALANAGANSSKEALEQEREFLRISVELKKKRVDLTNEEAAAIKSLIAAEHQLAKGGDQDPFTRWANAQKSAQDSLNDSISSGMDTLADGLAKAVTSGKDLRSTLQGVLKEISATFIRAGIRSLMADGMKQMNLGSIFASLTGGKDSISAALETGQSVLDRANGSLDKLAEESLKSVVTPNMDVQAAVVNINGGIGSGLDSFKPGASINDAIRPQGVGGITPNNATAPLFSNPLPDFKAGAKVGGLSAIPSNSASLFGAGQSGRQGLGDVSGSLKAIPDFKLSSAESIAAFGKGLQKLAPIAERVGVTPISGSLAEMYKRSGLDAGTIKNLQTVHPDLQKVILRAKELSGAKFTMNDGQGLRTQAQADENARKGLGICNSQHLEGTAADVNLYRNGRYIANGSDPAYRQFDSAMQQAAKEYGLPVTWGGTSKRFDADHWQLPRGWKGSHKQSATLGGNGAGLGKQLDGIGKPLGEESRKVADSLKKQMEATKNLATETQRSFNALAQTTQPLQGFDGGITKLGENLSQGVPAADSFTGELEKLIQKLLSGLGGDGGGLLSGAGELLGGLFEEGGVSTSPVAFGSASAAFWHGAPHYAEGTPNTSGGMPAILHPNEAVVPLSRGRSIPVEINGAGGGQTVINNHNHVTTNVQGVNDFHSFRRSHGQLMSAMQREAARLAARNN